MDNSEWMRNGDFVPSRFESEKDAVNLLFGSKINGHPENTVGLISMAEKYNTSLPRVESHDRQG